MAQARQPLALSLAGFQFSYRSNYFDWRLLHGIDVDTVIRLTDVKAVEDCLDTLQHGSFGVERDRLSPANCVQLFRLLQLSIEYCAHLRAAHALLLDCYNSATQAAEGWKAAARGYLDAGSSLVQDSVAVGAISRPALDATDTAKVALETADREYNAALDALEAEDSRARHFRFRKQRTEISWATLHAADADRLVAALDVTALEALLPNLTYGCITNEDDEQLTPHHFAQIIPLAQAGLDYTLWQANATGALLEQAMAVLQAACGDIPLLTSATQEMHNNITSLLLEAQQAGVGAVGGPGGGGGMGIGAGGSPLGAGMSLGGAGGMTAASLEAAYGGSGGLGASVGSPHQPWTSASVELGQSVQLGGSGRVGTPQPLRTSTPTFMAGRAGSGSAAQVLRLGGGGAGPSRFASVTGMGVGGPASRRLSASMASGTLEDLLAAAAAGGAGAGGGELHRSTAELSFKVEAIEHDLRMERSKTEEMRRILADIRERLNQQTTGGPVGLAAGGGGGLGLTSSQSLQAQHRRRPSAGAASFAGGMGLGGGGVTGVTDSVTFPAGIAGAGAGVGGSGSPFLNPPAASVALTGGGAGGGGVGSSSSGFGSFHLGPGSPPQGQLGGGGLGPSRLGGSTAGVGFPQSLPQQPDHHSHSPAKVRVFVDEDAIREQEQQRAVDLLAKQAERLKQQMLREHQERRQATAAAASASNLHLNLAGLGIGGGSGTAAGSAPGSSGLLRLKQEEGGSRRSRGLSRDNSQRSARHSSPSGRAAKHGSRHGGAGGMSGDYSSDPEWATLAAAGGPGSAGAGLSGPPGSAGASAGGGKGASRPPKPGLSRLSGPTAIHGSLGDLTAAASFGGAPTAAAANSGGGGGGLGGRRATGAGGAPSGTAGPHGFISAGPSARPGHQRHGPALIIDGDDPLALPPPALFSAESPTAAPSAYGAAALPPPPGAPSSFTQHPQQYQVPLPSGPPGPATRSPPPSAMMAAGSAFGSISLTGPAAEATAASAAAAAAARQRSFNDGRASGGYSHGQPGGLGGFGAGGAGGGGVGLGGPIAEGRIVPGSASGPSGGASKASSFSDSRASPPPGSHLGFQMPPPSLSGRMASAFAMLPGAGGVVGVGGGAGGGEFDVSGVVAAGMGRRR
ncbi:hypothetical protein HYH02_009863 [Chlamydomonas schloesseri]|uniref:Cilium assembly protein DZIP1 N-terminal domain-containing protein n=1 Tax=Chlamydomonas schloesseri TaxID=2026947 RepID=A0A835TAS7_9CHLO|nr:hypothetical protein HYH02_009863 [Chlamydomonas schloesseri]|eukprot:KAG2442072.1 hypothetical protein HYH02_009863 [Chlamydomonas schloesseri]